MTEWAPNQIMLTLAGTLWLFLMFSSAVLRCPRPAVLNAQAVAFMSIVGGLTLGMDFWPQWCLYLSTVLFTFLMGCMVGKTLKKSEQRK